MPAGIPMSADWEQLSWVRVVIITYDVDLPAGGPATSCSKWTDSLDDCFIERIR